MRRQIDDARVSSSVSPLLSQFQTDAMKQHERIHHMLLIRYKELLRHVVMNTILFADFRRFPAAVLQTKVAVIWMTLFASCAMQIDEISATSACFIATRMTRFVTSILKSTLEIESKKTFLLCLQVTQGFPPMYWFFLTVSLQSRFSPVCERPKSTNFLTQCKRGFSWGYNKGRCEKIVFNEFDLEIPMNGPYCSTNPGECSDEDQP